MKSSDIIRIENLSRKENVYTIRWNMTYLCNYNCDFCIQGNKNSHISKSKEESKEVRKKICNNLINFIETKINRKYNTLLIYLIGGEITILSDFFEILKKIVECKFEGNIEIQITTNLSTDKKILKSIVDLFQKEYEYGRYLIISASFYKEFTTEKDFIEKVSILYKKQELIRKILIKLRKNIFLRKIKMYFKKNSNSTEKKYRKGRIDVNINYPICIDSDYKNYLKFKRKYNGKAKYINFIIIRNYKKEISEKLRNKLNKYKYDKESIKVVNNIGEIYYLSSMNKISLKLEGEKDFNPNGYLCDVGINSISINNLGVVSRCVSCPNKTIIGNMLDGIFDLPIQKLKCPQFSCNCSYYGVIEKE